MNHSSQLREANMNHSSQLKEVTMSHLNKMVVGLSLLMILNLHLEKVIQGAADAEDRAEEGHQV